MNHFDYGMAPKVVADQVFQCLGCPGTTPVSSCLGLPDGTPCSDDNPCTTHDRCLAGGCTQSTPVVCEALDECHAVGTCSLERLSIRLRGQFVYEKEIVDEKDCYAANGLGDCSQTTIGGKTVIPAKTPIKVGCDVPGRWRNRNCVEGTPGADKVADYLVELDIMGFLRAISNQGAAAQRMSNSQFLGVMKGKYHSGISVTWESEGTNRYSYSKRILEDIANDVPSDPRYVWASQKADSYGINKNTKAAP